MLNGRDLTMNRKCKKCGRLLAESNKGKLCEICKADIIERIKSKTLIWVCCLIIGIFIGMCLWSIKKYPITYEDCIMQVVDKREKKSFAYTGNAIVSSTRYYLLFDDGKELRVSSAMYDDTNIDDYIIITYLYQKDRVIYTKIKFNK